MKAIPSSNEDSPDVRQLQVFQVLLREQNLTRTAEVLNVSQPAVSKVLARLRRHFSDPLFVRVGRRMEPTTRALELEAIVSSILDQLTLLRSRHAGFDSRHSDRTFRFSVVDAGIVRLLPPLIRYVHEHAPGVRFSVVPLDVARLESLLESGALDFAMGSFESVSKKVRRQLLWTISYASVVRRDHPRILTDPTLDEFVAEKHVLVSIAGTGHAHGRAERAIEKVVPRENVTCRVPTFLAAAIIASKTNSVVTLPAMMAESVAEEFGLRLVETPVRLPQIGISQYWHDRFHRDPGNEWVRGVFAELFKA